MGREGLCGRRGIGLKKGGKDGLLGMTLSVDTEGTILDINHVAWSLGLSEISTSLALGGPDPFSSISKSGFRIFLEFVILAEHLDFYHLEKKNS